MNLFNLIQQGEDIFKTGSLTTFPRYLVTQTTNYKFNASIPVTISIPTGTSVFYTTCSLQVWVSGSSRNELIKRQDQKVVVGDPPSATLTFNGTLVSNFSFTIDQAIPSVTFISINSGKIYPYTNSDCTGIPLHPLDSIINQTSTAKLYPTVAGATAYGNQSAPFTTDYASYIIDNQLTVNGTSVANGSTITIGGTQVTIVIPQSCMTPPF
jgi:hypothetical protein